MMTEEKKLDSALNIYDYRGALANELFELEIMLLKRKIPLESNDIRAQLTIHFTAVSLQRYSRGSL